MLSRNDLSMDDFLLLAAASFAGGDMRLGAMVDAYYCLLQLRGILMMGRDLLELRKPSCWELVKEFDAL